MALTGSPAMDGSYSARLYAQKNKINRGLQMQSLFLCRMSVFKNHADKNIVFALCRTLRLLYESTATACVRQKSAHFPSPWAARIAITPQSPPSLRGPRKKPHKINRILRGPRNIPHKTQVVLRGPRNIPHKINRILRGPRKHTFHIKKTPHSTL